MSVAEKISPVRVAPVPADSGLVERCIAGDQDSWKQLVTRYQRLSYSIALRICRDSEAAADILQQVCLELYRRLDEVRNVASLPAWVATVTRRKSYDYLRELKPTEPLLHETSGDSAEIFDNIERHHALEKAMTGLPERNRRLIELMYMSGESHSYEEISAELGIPVASIGPTRIRSLKKLRALLG
jgi:RNA polymerase sigma factor (sigma-70 family)